MKKQIIMVLLLAIAVIFAGCSSDSSTESETSSDTTETTATVQSVSTVDTADMFSDRDMEIGYDEETSAKIILSGNSATASSDAVEISGSTVTITEEGTYILSGTLDDGMIIVNAEDSDKIQLVLDNVQITSCTSAAVYVKEADKVFLTMSSGSENTLINGGEYTAIDDNNIDSVIFSKSDLTLNGSGTLSIQAKAGHGIVSKDDLVITSGTYNITAVKHGLSGKDSVRIANGTYTIESEKDGIHAENNDDTSKGFVYIADGVLNITSDGDGISTGTYLLIADGDFTIQAGGGAGEALSESQIDKFKGGEDYIDSDTAESISTKGLKAETELAISGGTFSIDTADDALHSNGDLMIGAGTFDIVSGDDGMHADSALTIDSGTITISESYEGLEGLSIDINGGTIDLVASDDGLNAAGGNDSSGNGGRGDDVFGTTEGAYIKITGGTLHINASGDGIDSNNSLTVTGGETYVSGPTNSGNGALDYAGEATISGGIFVAAGTTGMAQNFSSSSTQGCMMISVDSGSAGSTISLTDSDGNEVISWEADKEYSSVVISCPEITEGSTYTLTTDGTSVEVTMDSLVYSSGSGENSKDNEGHGNMGENHGGRK